MNGIAERRDLAPRGRVWPLSVAPMMDRTDRHFRFFLRQVSRRTLLYTEMITTGALLHGRRDEILSFHPSERPLAVQLGGDAPEELAACARLAEEAGYDEVNLNVGCPSDRVRRGRFGVCLMAQPHRVAAAVEAMREAVSLPVTVKHRIGFDDLDRYEDMLRFVDAVAEAGCDRFIVHARKAWLRGLSPRQNREVPPLRYADVYRLKEDRPELRVEINGGISSLEEVGLHLERVDGVMVGRAAYDRPYLLAEADGLYGEEAREPPTRRQVLERVLPYIERELTRSVPLPRMTRHLLGLFTGAPGARAWRRHLSEHAPRPGADVGVVLEAARLVPAEVLDSSPVLEPA